jgi:hypothetical protein
MAMAKAGASGQGFKKEEIPPGNAVCSAGPSRPELLYLIYLPSFC